MYRGITNLVESRLAQLKADTIYIVWKDSPYKEECGWSWGYSPNETELFFPHQDAEDIWILKDPTLTEEELFGWLVDEVDPPFDVKVIRNNLPKIHPLNDPQKMWGDDEI